MRVDARQQDHTLIVELAGDWALGQPAPHVAELVDAHADAGAVRALGFDATHLGAWDSSLLAFLLEALRYSEERQLVFREETLPEGVARLIALSRAVPERQIERDEKEASAFAALGQKGLALYEGGMASVSFLGEVALSFAGLLRLRTRIRWRDFWMVVHSNSAGALPIVALISFLVGLIIAFLGAVILQRFGAGYYVSYLVSYGMLRELGALMTGIIMTGRTGAAFAAELGSMKITEELDAYRTLGISPIDYLVLPRVVALVLMMPLLTIYADCIGIIGGMVVAITMLDLSVPFFITGLLEPVVLQDALLGVFKGTVFGVIIGVAGCMRGMQTGSDAGAVGKAATSAVVTGITFIILSNAVIDWAAALLQI